jgi:hypothetical protein
VIKAIANGSNANNLIVNSSPSYIDGDSIVWGLIRGADKIMQQTKLNDYDFYHIDNAYFGRDLFFRITKNALQLSKLPNLIIDDRYKKILSYLGKDIEPWKTTRNGPILLCPSSNFLYSFYGSSLSEWVSDTINQIRSYSDRPIKIRYKELIPKDDIDHDILDAWCVVTHVSAAALDSLRLGIPVIVTGSCAASPLSTPIKDIENPKMEDGRHELFSYLAWGQFSVEEFSKHNIINEIQCFYDN